MSDVADILGFAPKAALPSAADEASRIMAGPLKSSSMTSNKPFKKPKGMSREVYDLVGNDGFLPAQQSNVINPVFKNKRAVPLKGKWCWASINPRDPNCSIYHWAKADLLHVEYPYLKFNVHTPVLKFTDEEYCAFLVRNDWSKEETEVLLNCCSAFDLRWPVIADRIRISRPVEELQARYYEVSDRLEQSRIAAMSSFGAVSTERRSTFDVEFERRRRVAQDILFKKTKADELEEIKLREELKAIDSALKRCKKTTKSAPVTTTTAAAPKTDQNAAVLVTDSVSGINAVDSSQSITDPLSQAPVSVLEAVSSVSKLTNPIVVESTEFMPGKPALQSSRLYTLDRTTGLSKNLLRKMNSFLQELGIPENPLPTRLVCDMVDEIRQDTIALMSIHSAIRKKEKELAQLLNPNKSVDTKQGASTSGSGQNVESKPNARKRSSNGSRSRAKSTAVSSELGRVNAKPSMEMPKGKAMEAKEGESDSKNVKRKMDCIDEAFIMDASFSGDDILIADLGIALDYSDDLKSIS